MLEGHRKRQRRSSSQEQSFQSGTIPNNLCLLERDPKWDILVVVGVEKREYRLREDIIARQGGYFASKTLRKFKEGREKKIVFEHFETEAFDEVVKWLYGDKFTFHHDNFMWIDAVFQMADYLLLQSLKDAIVGEFDQQMKPTGGTLPQLFADALAADPSFSPFTYLESIFRYAPNSEYGSVKKCTDHLVKHFALDKDDARNLVGLGGESSGTYLTALLTSYSDAMNTEWVQDI
ncbi:hypothetical protein TWF481_001472 [Arthrobotrys musiformis]|uniref:BTB domain-containing protein n=1 Tax=Arthrobotrys musiformis TaxID=47236 RepID=A0AAV9WQW5_9PEZI